RRVDVGDGHQGRSDRQILDRAAVLDRGHCEGILRLHSADAPGGPYDVRTLDVRLVHGQMARGDRQIHRLDHDAALPVQYAERMGDLKNSPERLQVTVPASPFAVRDVRGAVHRSEIDDVASHVQV